MNLDDAEKAKLTTLVKEFMESRKMGTDDIARLKINMQVVVLKQGRTNEDLYVNVDVQTG